MEKTTAQPNPHAMDTATSTATTPRVEDLLRHGDADFVQRAYRCILGREADESGLATYVGLLRDGGSKAHLLVTLAESSEARGRTIELAGLAELVQAARPQAPSLWARLLQRVLRPLQTQSHALERNLRIVDNHMHRLQAALDMQTQELVSLRAEVAELKTLVRTAHEAAGIAVAAQPPTLPTMTAIRQVPPRADALLTRLRRAKALRFGTSPS